MTAQNSRIIAIADAATIRSTINRLALATTVPAPDVYEILAALKLVGHRLPQTTNQLSDGLGLGSFRFCRGLHPNNPERTYPALPRPAAHRCEPVRGVRHAAGPRSAVAW